ncbi:MAG: PilN domain-containing protein [Phycisphaerales bacterium]
MTNSTPTSFLPEDYLAQRQETKTNIIHLILFGVVLFGVIGAFFVTHRQWASVREQQYEINRQYTAENEKIEQLKALEKQKAEMLERAEITTALLERVPRSILLAELINRMPERVTMTEITLQSKRLPDEVPKSAKPTGAPQSLSATKSAAPGAPVEAPKPKPAKYEYTIVMVGYSAADQDVADFQTSLKECPLITGVDLASAQEQTVNDVALRKFKIEAKIRPDADARRIEPLQIPRLRSLNGSGLTKGKTSGVTPAKGETAGAEQPK